MPTGLRFVAAFALLLLSVGASFAQVQSQQPVAIVVSTCGTPPYTYVQGKQYPLTVDTSGNLCLSASGGPTSPPIVVTSTDKGGTITAGGTAQTLAAANASRRSIIIQNPCSAAEQNIVTAEDLTLSLGGSATITGINATVLSPCGSTSITVGNQVYQGAISVNAATTSHRWYAVEFQ